MQRRSFLKQATLGAAAGGAALAAPGARFPTIHWRLASSFPRSADAIFTGGENLAKYVSEATDGKFSIRAFPAGEIVPALQVLDAVRTAPSSAAIPPRTTTSARIRRCASTARCRSA